MLGAPQLARWIAHSRSSILAEAERQSKPPFAFAIVTSWLMNFCSVQLQERFVAGPLAEPTLAIDSRKGYFPLLQTPKRSH